MGLIALNARTATVSRPGTAFGTTVNITVSARSESQANVAIDAAFAEIRTVHRAASLFDPSSEIIKLNVNGVLEKPSRTVLDIIEVSDLLHRLSHGAFDPSIQPLWELWANGNPDQQSIDSTLRHVGWQKLRVTPARLQLLEGAALSFNGVAQGYAADRVMAALNTNGALAAIIDTGETGRLDWDGRIAIQHPRQPTSLGSIALHHGFVAVSGDYATAFSQDCIHHHIFDPRLGFSPKELASVAVVAPTGAMADGLATAFMVMGAAPSFACLKTLAGCSALFIDKAGAITLSPGMNARFQNT